MASQERDGRQGAGDPRAACWLGSAIVILIVVALGVLYHGKIHLPPNTLPWKPVDLNAPPGWIAHWQLNRLGDDKPACRIAISHTVLRYTPMADRRIDDACGFTNVVRADVSPITFAPRVTATCGLTAALYWFQRGAAAAAAAQMQSRLVRIDQVGTFACRNVNGEAVGSRSEHATADAIDVTAFHFADGRIVTVGRDYGRPTAAGRFLQATHDAACGVFNGVLGPDYNRLHATHFHLDMGPYRICH
jgi:hypothetical protein